MRITIEKVDCPDRIRWWRQLRDRGPQQRGVRQLLFVLSSWMNDDGSRCFPSQAEIARAAVLTEKATQRLLKTAEREGWVRVIQERTRGHGWRRCRYVPTLPIPVLHMEQRPLLAEGTLDEVRPNSGEGTL